METRPLEGLDRLEEDYAHEVPEDVAVLYSWANLDGGRYQDFSANRREHRAQMRQRAAQQMRVIELQAQAEAEAVAEQAEMDASADLTARQAAERASGQASVTMNLGGHAWADSREVRGDQDAGVKHPYRTAPQEARKAAAEREAAARRSEAAALHEDMARCAEQEAEVRGRLATRLDSSAEGSYPSSWSDGHPGVELEDAVSAANGMVTAKLEEIESRATPESLSDGNIFETRVDVESVHEAQTSSSTAPPPPTSSSGLASAAAEPPAEVIIRLPSAEGATLSLLGEMPPRPPLQPGSLFEFEPHAMSELFEAEPVSHGDMVWKQRNGDEAALQGPAWLYPVRHVAAMHRPLGTSAHLPEVPESLKHSKERIAARWFALRGVFARHDTAWTGRQPVAEDEKKRTPLVVVFSLAGGTGKTSLVATLGRALSFLGERVLLSDTTPNGLLPFYFGSGHRASGVLRVFLPPPGSTDAPVRLVGYDVPLESEKAGELTTIVEDLLENSQRVNRVLIDLSVIGSKIAGRLGQFKPMVLVPLMPDMNSVISIDAVERLFGSMLDDDGCPLRPVYLLNQFDPALPLHLDIREVLSQQLGERLLPFVIRRSPSVGEALAEGMTILDYDPDCAAAADYVRVANWLRSDSAPVGAGLRNQRWSEQ